MDTGNTQDAAQAAGLTPLKGMGVVLAVVIAVAGLIGIAVALKLTALYASFLFVLYWSGLCHANLKEFVPALIGSLGGLAMAYGLVGLPGALGEAAGMALALALILLAIYLLVMGQARILVNNAFMLFLTVGTIPALMNGPTLGDMGLAVVVGALYVGGLVLIGKQLAARGAQKAMA